MRVLGIGVDVVKNKRIKSLINNSKFIKRTFSINEIKFSRKNNYRTSYFSKRFAAKEALVKAIGTGFRNNLNFKDIEIFNDNLGKPYYFINQKIKRLLKKKKKITNFKLFLSISDEKDYSIAFTIIQKF